MGIIVDEKGVTIETLEEIKLDLANDLRDPVQGIDPDLDVSETGPIGQMIGIYADRLHNIQAAIQSIAAKQDVDQADGVHLDAAFSVTGVERVDPTASTVTLRLHGDPSTEIASGSIVKHSSSESLWETAADATIGGGGTVDVAAKSQEKASYSFLATTGWDIVTPISGWDSVESIVDTTPGSDPELDPIYRARGKSGVAGLGGGSIPAVRAALLDTNGVNAASVFHNPYDVFDAEGRDPYSVEAVVSGGTNADIAATLWAVAPSTKWYGSVSENVIDGEGQTQVIKFNRPSTVDMHVRVTIDTTDAEVDIQSTAEADLEAAVLTYGLTLQSGNDVVPAFISRACLGAIPDRSVVSITVEVSDDGASWQTTTYAISDRDRAVFDSTRTTIVGAP